MLITFIIVSKKEEQPGQHIASIPGMIPGRCSSDDKTVLQVRSAMYLCSSAGLILSGYFETLKRIPFRSHLSRENNLNKNNFISFWLFYADAWHDHHIQFSVPTW
jgi:hypothetical protein